ncbi:glycosyltransferase family 4 protein [Bosea sp. TND4EK4]|uniref:glycosyltransferase family 4 protein n=1 Tax=Bosea sp. TND4EK4 TaxID=1907408 RepID=UPI000956B4B1|nr:glycosyltransferase family 4 protein [Bosea sp. TND4EK4]SIR47364.1 Glycosyltransferase involved in cell wall bisynthesis [Bosea sp. TND4EK4]
MKIFQILPRRMRFSRIRASSVELCVSEWVGGSRFRDQTTVFAEAGSDPLVDVAVHRWQPAERGVSWQTALEIRREAARRGCDLIIVQQHIATAARIARFNSNIPVILSTHNYVERAATTFPRTLRNLLVQQRLRRLGGITLISEATRQDFAENWPGVQIPRAVVSNGFDFSAWQPRAQRDRLILVVGRATEEKGLLEAAQGIATFLADHADWKAALVLSEAERNPAYSQAIRAALSPCAERAELLSGIPYAEVRSLSERSAIAIVPSKWNEPFGRTALEAHAGGAALISSGTGGLREISGESAVYLRSVNGPAIDEALRVLSADEDLRQSLARSGADRVRNLFRISGPSGSTEAVPSICERLDRFCESVVARSHGFPPREEGGSP